MEQLSTHMAFTCLNTECQKKIRLSIPEKSGVYSITCPYCGVVKKIKLKGLDVLQNAANGFGEQLADATIDNSTKQPIDIGDDFYVNQTYNVSCPYCNENIEIKQVKAGTGMLVCKKCKGRVQLTVRKPTETIIKSEMIQCFKGKLILLRRGWLNKDYHLKEGKNIVGRYDEIKMSDISIKGDVSMSRQSIEIEVDHHEKGYSFKLTVKNSTNPVLHNNKPLAIGDSISLNFGDSIILGKTKFRFDKDL